MLRLDRDRRRPAARARRSRPPAAAVLCLALAACACRQEARPPAAKTSPAAARDAMVATQLRARGIRDERVLEAMRTVPRHRFVPEGLRARAYDDSPLPIGRGQTISQPYVVAFMAEALRLEGDERVLEVGSGSGYAAAVLARLAREVYGIELERELWERSVAAIEALGYDRVHLRHGDGFAGWPEAAPFEAIVISAATPAVPAPLWDQLAPGGRLVYPKGESGEVQRLAVVVKTPDGPRETILTPVRFVPLRREGR